MLTASRLIYLIVYVNDLAESRAFYENRLGLRVIEADGDAVRLDAGQIDLSLNRASDRGVTLVGRRDDSSDIVFLVEDLEATRSDLEARGVTFVRRRSYEVGLVTDFYDPNGHRLMLYQPSEVALTWPSADKLREVWRARGRGGSELIGAPAGPSAGPDSGLAGKPLVYLFMFEDDQVKAFDFYRDALGLTVLERVHCCNQDCAEEIEGIAKYDGGGVLLSTHHVHKSSMVVDDSGLPYSPGEFSPEHASGIAPVFLVGGIHRLVAALSRRGIHFEQGVQRLPSGAMARFEDPFGHPFFLFEPSAEAGGPRNMDPAAATVN
jgi:catechol 2,3-dioxygenase-like lactoylglutathione lyase family enzyme